ncbi:MAG: hypothetical protein ACR2O4_15675, partial [Hyphomicrobiaceae bacterium]
SINVAKWRVYASCLSDLTIFSAALVRRENNLTDEQAVDLANFCFEVSVERSFEDNDDADFQAEIIQALDARARLTDWRHASEGENAFSKSPPDLVKWAPVTEEFRELDGDIVTNSIRFRWRDVREQLRKRADAAAIGNEWKSGTSRAPLN